jgi:hypothetical protein
VAVGTYPANMPLGNATEISSVCHPWN